MTIVGGKGTALTVHLSAVRTDQDSPRDAVDRLARSAASNVDGEIRSHLESFLCKVLFDSLRRGHGALVAVVAEPGSIKVGLGAEDAEIDGILLQNPIELSEAVARCQQSTFADSAELLAFASLLEGMLSADGITILGADGTIHGYNVFVNHAPGDRSGVRVGGARRRAFAALKGRVEAGELHGAFFRSSDGGAEFIGAGDSNDV